MKASERQVGGSHYKNMKIQPSQFIQANKLSWYEGNIIKYACRHAAKGGIEDIDKIIHYAELLKEEYENETDPNRGQRSDASDSDPDGIGPLFQTSRRHNGGPV